MKKLLFFVNPGAGHAEIRTSLFDVLRIFAESGYETTVHMTQAPRDITRHVVQCGSGYDLVVCTGGDGTLNELVSGVMEIPESDRPMIGYIPGGTTNDMASTLGMSRNAAAAARQLMNGVPFAIDIGKFGEDRWFDYVAAFGLFTAVPYDTPQEDKRIFGKLAYLFNGARELQDVRPVHVHVFCNGEETEMDLIDGLVCSTTSVAGVPTPKGMDVSLNDGKSEVILIRSFRNVLDLNAAAAAILRQELPEPYFVTYRTDCIRFVFDEPTAWTLDGEYGGTVSNVEIRNISRAVTFLVPAPDQKEEQTAASD